MSFFSELNGFNKNAIRNLYEPKKEEDKQDYSEVDFCIDNYDENALYADFQGGNGISEADFFDGNGNGAADFIDGNGNGFYDNDSNGMEAGSEYVQAMIADYMNDHNVSALEAEEYIKDMDLEG